jgi:hypothetical protein
MVGFYQADVIGNPVSGAVVYNGSVVSLVSKLNTQILHPDNNEPTVPAATFDDLKDRFDDPTYYTA